MSHWSILKIRIKNPNKNLLREVVKMVAKEMGLRITLENDEMIAFRYKAVYSDVKILLNTAEVKYDSSYVPAEVANKIQQLLVQNYTALALNMGLRSLGYQVSSNKVGDKIVIRAVG